MNTHAFIHIPKCAGFSIKRAIKDNNLPIRIFDHGVIFSNIPTHLKQIIILRDPIDRFTSAFYYIKGAYVKNTIFNNPNEFLDDLKLHTEESKKFIKPQPHYHSVNGVRINTDWVFHPQSAWVDNPDIIMFQENLQEDFDKLGFNVSLPRINVSPRSDFKYSKDNIEYLRDWYGQDFELYRKGKKIK